MNATQYNCRRLYDYCGVRLMTAEDLGLPLALWKEMGEAYWDFAFGRRKAPEAPYAFWLGAVDPDSWDCA